MIIGFKDVDIFVKSFDIYPKKKLIDKSNPKSVHRITYLVLYLMMMMRI